jgi:hypothetical protein
MIPPYLENVVEFDRFKRRYSKDAEGHEHAADSGQFTGKNIVTDKKTGHARVSSEVRHRDANLDSEFAHSASEQANKSGRKDHHVLAGYAHRTAAKSHIKAGNHAVASMHTEKAAEHEKHGGGKGQAGVLI